jgi:hypothetical protein
LTHVVKKAQGLGLASIVVDVQNVRASCIGLFFLTILGCPKIVTRGEHFSSAS